MKKLLTKEKIIKQELNTDIALRPDKNKHLDDVYVKNVSFFRMEKMNNKTIWLACILQNGERISWSIFIKKNKIRMRTIEFPKKVKYEKGSLLNKKNEICMGGWKNK